MNFTRAQLIMIGSVVFVALLLVGIFTGILPGTRTATQQPPQISLTMWGIEDRSTMQNVIGSYQNLRTNVRINYEQHDPSAYEQDLLNALAAGTGPDIAMFHSSWLPKHYDKIIPASDAQMSAVNLDKIFPSVVTQDFVGKDAAGKSSVYALPLYIDTLALIYNQDTFDKNGIALAPKDLLDLQNLIPKLLQKDANGTITKPAIAIGGSAATVDNAGDLLALFMLQAGTQMNNDTGTQATFSENVQGKIPGLDALAFYTKFADPTNTYYTWNDSLPYSLDSFAKGNTAMIFAYQSELDAIKNKNPYLNFKAAPMPQPSGAQKAVNYADYWGLAVTKNSKNSDWAWDAILYLTANETPAGQYVQATQHPPALRTLIQKYANDPNLGVFAQQALSARSWSEINKPAIRNIFSQMISAVISKQLQPQDALVQAEHQVTELMQARK